MLHEQENIVLSRFKDGKLESVLDPLYSVAYRSQTYLFFQTIDRGLKMKPPFFSTARETSLDVRCDEIHFKERKVCWVLVNRGETVDKGKGKNGNT